MVFDDIVLFTKGVEMPEMKKKIAYIVTYTGKIFEFLSPKPEMICIEDISHSLSNLCRYTGHVSSFYSVAQHCVLMAENFNFPGDPLAKLLHDAAEAYIGDLASPWKGLLNVEGYFPGDVLSVKEYESKIQKVIEAALGVSEIHNAEVKESDIRMFWTEVRDLMPQMSDDFNWGPPKMEPAKEKIICWEPSQAKMQFLMLYNKLKGV